jgi:hypothetical protein
VNCIEQLKIFYPESVDIICSNEVRGTYRFIIWDELLDTAAPILVPNMGEPKQAKMQYGPQKNTRKGKGKKYV